MLSLMYDDWVHFKVWSSAEVLGEVRINLCVLLKGGCQDPFQFIGKLRLVLPAMGQTGLFQSRPETSLQWMGTPEEEEEEDEGLRKTSQWQESLCGELDINCAEYLLLLSLFSKKMMSG